MGCGASKPAGLGVATSAPEKPGNHEAAAKAEQIEKTEEEQTRDLEQEAKQEAERIAKRYANAPAAERYAGKASELLEALEERRKNFKEATESLTGNKGLVAAAELARQLFPAPFELEDGACSAVATSITEGVGKVFQLAPPPLNAALVPLGQVLGAVVDQVRLVTANKKAAQQLSERVLEAARTISELLRCIGQAKDPGAAGAKIKSDVEQLTQLLDGEEGALPFLKRFCERGYLATMWNGQTDRAKFEELDSGILEALKRMDEAVGRRTLVVVQHVYDMVEEILGVVRRLEDRMQEVVDQLPPKSNTATGRKIWLEVAIDPPPGLHIGGQSRLAGVIRRTNGIHELLEQKHSLDLLRSQRNLPIRFADAKSLPTSICAAQVVLWLSLGSDCLKSSEADVEHVKAALNAMDQIHRPQLLIVCMKYGAKRVGEALAPLVPVIWMRGDLVSTSSGLAPASHQLQCVAKTVVPTLHKLLDGRPRLSLVDAAHKIGQSSAGCIEQAGAVGELLQDMDSQQELAENDPPFLRNFDADRFQDVTRCKVKELLSQDIEHVNKIRQQLEEAEDPRIHLVSEGTNAHERLRSVALHVLETLAVSKYTSIIRVGKVSTLEGKPIKNSTLMWLDLSKPPTDKDQQLLDELLSEWDKECENMAVLITTESDWEAGAPFQRIAICPGDGKGSSVSELHGDIPIACHSESKGSIALLDYLSRTELAEMIRDVMEKIDQAFLAGIFEGNEESNLILRVCVNDVGFLHSLRDRILQAEFGSVLVTAAREKALGVERSLRRANTEKLRDQLVSPQSASSDGDAAAAADSLPDPRRLPMPEDLTIKVGLTAFAEMYEASILRLDKLTPHQEEKMRIGLKLIDDGKSLHIKAPAGAGKTFVALHLILQKLTGGHVLFVAV